MILVDTSVWVDHFRSRDAILTQLIVEGAILHHPFVTGELAVGNLHQRERTILMLRSLPQIEPVDEDEFFDFMTSASLHGTGLGFVDIHLLAAIDWSNGQKLWTRDRKMREQAERFDLYREP